MTRNTLADTPTEASATPAEPNLLQRLDQLTTALEALAQSLSTFAVDPELKLYTPAEAAAYLGKTENWVVEAIQNGRIAHTRVGQSPRLKADHLRAIADDGEVKPNRYGRRRATSSRPKAA